MLQSPSPNSSCIRDILDIKTIHVPSSNSLCFWESWLMRCKPTNYLLLSAKLNLTMFINSISLIQNVLEKWKHTQTMTSSIQWYVQGKGRHVDDLYHTQAVQEWILHCPSPTILSWSLHVQAKHTHPHFPLMLPNAMAYNLNQFYWILSHQKTKMTNKVIR